MIGDYAFSHLPQDVQLLRDLGKVAGSAHAPFFAGVDPALLGMDTFGELSNPRDLGKIFETPDYGAWKSLRDSPDSRYIGLCMPRVLARLPYGAKTEPVEEFAFEEETDGHSGDKYAWMNAAYAMASNINRAYKEHGWTVRIRGVQSGGEVINLPSHTFPTDDGGVDLKCPTEIAISDRREAELSKAGLIPLIHRKNTDKAAFIGAQSLYKPRTFSGPDAVAATASDNLSSRLPYMFAVSRFAHYLKCMVRDKIGSTKDRKQLQEWLQDWLTDYIDGSPSTSSEAVKAEKPLAEGRVDIFEDEGKPWLLLGQVLPPPSLPDGRDGYRHELGVSPSGRGQIKPVSNSTECAATRTYNQVLRTYDGHAKNSGDAWRVKCPRQISS